MSKKVSVVIVTKNRENDLKQCLGSLLTQSSKLDQLVIVDNNSSDNTQEIAENLQKNSNFLIKYVLEKKVGYPTIYNRGLKEAKYDWVAFIDDDCVAEIDWFEKIKSRVSLSKAQDLIAILGFADTYQKNNVFSLVTNFFDYIWKEAGHFSGRVTDFEILDNKNIVYNKKLLLKNSLIFDETRVKEMNGASEDCDLGRQINSVSGKAFYDKKIIVSHKDPNNFLWFWKKYLASVRAYRSFSNKWQTEEYNPKKKNLILKNELQLFIAKNKLNYFNKLRFYFLVYLHVLLDYYFIFIDMIGMN